MGAHLEIYIERSCRNCQAAMNIAERLRGRMPAVRLSLIDLDREPQRRPKQVFAVPTYVLDGEILSLGNLRMEDLLAALRERLKLSTHEVADYGNPENSRSYAN